ncbi:helix-turn-helix domain-containing protein [Streptomyces sp. NPDC058284]|uniref:helix-turn-helix domain-containing protein n=1 Tax=unclassified Streptomyces TaxID=2593676 RepID=UPI003657F29B
MAFASTRPAHFDLQPYAGFDMGRYVRRTYCSWETVGWQSLLVQRFEHVPVVEDMALPGVADLHLVLPVAGRAAMETTRSDGPKNRHAWAPGRLELMIPGRSVLRSYRGDEAMRSVQIHIPRGTVDTVAEQLGVGSAVDYEAMAASLATGDPLIEEAVRTLGTMDEAADDVYAESAAAFLTAHLLTRHASRGRRSRDGRRPDPRTRTGTGTGAQEDVRVATAVAMMRDRLAEPVTLAEIAAEVHLSVYHFVRVFKAATGMTPYRYLVRLRVEEAGRLLETTDLAIARIAPRCGFAGPGALSAAFLRQTGMRPSEYRNS